VAKARRGEEHKKGGIKKDADRRLIKFSRSIRGTVGPTKKRKGGGKVKRRLMRTLNQGIAKEKTLDTGLLKARKGRRRKGGEGQKGGKRRSWMNERERDQT